MKGRLVYELRQRPAGRGWGAYWLDTPGDSVTGTELDEFFTNRLRLHDLPTSLPFVGAFKLTAGSWLAVWHRPDIQRIDGQILPNTEWRQLGGRLGPYLAQLDPDFASAYLSAEVKRSWKDNGLLPFHPLDPSCERYLPLALAFLQSRFPTSPTLRGFGSAWPSETPRPPGLEVCPFEVRAPDELLSLVERLDARGALVVDHGSDKEPGKDRPAPHPKPTRIQSEVDSAPAVVAKLSIIEETLAQLKVKLGRQQPARIATHWLLCVTIGLALGLALGFGLPLFQHDPVVLAAQTAASKVLEGTPSPTKELEPKLTKIKGEIETLRNAVQDLKSVCEKPKPSQSETRAPTARPQNKTPVETKVEEVVQPATEDSEGQGGR